MKISSDEVKEILSILERSLERPFRDLRTRDLLGILNKVNGDNVPAKWGGIAYQGLQLTVNSALPDACIFTPEIKAELDAIQDRYYNHVTSPISWAKSIVSSAIARSLCTADLFKLVPRDIVEILVGYIPIDSNEPSSLTQRDILAFQESCKGAMGKYRQLETFRALGVY